MIKTNVRYKQDFKTDSGIYYWYSSVLLGIAGTLDYRAEVIYSMSQETYDEIVEKVGKSESKIVEEYMSNKAYYDSLP